MEIARHSTPGAIARIASTAPSGSLDLVGLREQHHRFGSAVPGDDQEAFEALEIDRPIHPLHHEDVVDIRREYLGFGDATRRPSHEGGAPIGDGRNDELSIVLFIGSDRHEVARGRGHPGAGPDRGRCRRHDLTVTDEDDAGAAVGTGHSSAQVRTQVICPPVQCEGSSPASRVRGRVGTSDRSWVARPVVIRAEVLVQEVALEDEKVLGDHRLGGHVGDTAEWEYLMGSALSEQC